MKKHIKRKDQVLLHIKWHDAHTEGGWFNSEQTNKFLNEDYCIVENTGWLLYEDDKEIVLCSRRITWDLKEDEKTSEFGLLQKIPNTWIIERKILMQPKEA